MISSARRHILAGSVLAIAAFPAAVDAQSLPPDGESATARLAASPRHGEWVTYDAGGGDMVQAWVSYPQRSDAAPVVVVIHDIRAMSDWARAVGDQLAADGFIAVTQTCSRAKDPAAPAPSHWIPRRSDVPCANWIAQRSTDV